MLKSMTGYGRGEKKSGDRELVVEIKTLNHRYTDFNIKMPKHLSFLEDEIKRYVQRLVLRGRVEVYINFKNNYGQTPKLVVNDSLIEQYINVMKHIAHRYNTELKLDAQAIVQYPDVINVEEEAEDEDALRSFIFSALDDALDNLIAMRTREGEQMKDDMARRLDAIEAMMDKIDERIPEMVKEYQNNLNKRIQELIGQVEVDQVRLANEVAYFAERSNVAEEITRLRSHISQMRSTMESHEPVGRKLDFIIQEMNREVNTIASKAGDIQIINMVVDIKTELEKIREQVQNIE
ncbi:MAG TPA: YicC family protein [Clostridiales bacterium]|nr:YicC family protein [Clostridiales bacterium]